ncbi:hypothetical protein [Flavobacterium sp.]|uniref:hypothetical protein n=1 Tax=Flavobacterium sp. TaxID=239 RepID=UPI003D28AA8F
MKYYLTCLLLLTQFFCFSSPRITVKKEFENVILFYDGNTNNEEYVKLEFIAKRVLLLSKQYDYTEKIILNYLFSDERNEKDYFIAYSKPLYLYKHKDSEKTEEIKLLDEDAKFVMLTAYDEIRSQVEALKLIDFALSNLKSFKNIDTHKIQYDRFKFEYNYIYSIDSKKIKKIIDKKDNSYFVINALNKKIYRETKSDKSTYFISYFTKNDKYYPFLSEREKETVLDSLNEIKYYARELNNVFIFKNKFEFNFYAFPNFGEDLVKDLIIKLNVVYNENETFNCSNIFVDEILTGVYLLKYISGYLGTVESSIFTIEKGMIEKTLSKYEYNHPSPF